MDPIITTTEHARREALLDLAEWEPYTPEPASLEDVTVTGRAIVVQIHPESRPYSFSYAQRPQSGDRAAADFTSLVLTATKARRSGRTDFSTRHSMTMRWHWSTS